jgi:hypothetical protein
MYFAVLLQYNFDVPAEMLPRWNRILPLALIDPCNAVGASGDVTPDRRFSQEVYNLDVF